MLEHYDIRMTLAIYTHATYIMQDSPPQPRLKRHFLEPAVDTPLKTGLGSSIETLYFSAICRTFICGGTRIRTGDTMILSYRRTMLSCVVKPSDPHKPAKTLCSVSQLILARVVLEEAEAPLDADQCEQRGAIRGA